MKDYDVHRDGYRLSWGGKIGLMLIGFLFGWVGILIDWAIGHRRKMMKCSAESIFLGVIGASIGVICWFIAIANGAALDANAWWLFGCGLPRLLVGTSISGWSIFWLVIAILEIIFSMLWVYGMRLKMTPEEKRSVLPGDDWIKPGERHLRYDSAETIFAPADHVWALVKQSGQTKAGWYSFDWLERLCTFDIHNHYDIHPEWQDLKPGDYQWFHQAPLSIGEWVTEVSDVPPYGWAAHSDTATDPSYKHRGPNGEAALKLWFKRFCWTWNWQVKPLDGNSCRLMWRCDCTFDKWNRPNKYFVVFILGTASIVMGRGYMKCMKRLAEGRMTYPDKKK